MLKSIKDVLIDYVVLGFVFGVLSVLWAHEPLSRTDKVKKVVASISIALIVGGVCSGCNVNENLTFAIIGGFCSYAREIFDCFGALLKLMMDKPLQTIRQLVDIVRGNGNDKGKID